MKYPVAIVTAMGLLMLGVSGCASSKPSQSPSLLVNGGMDGDTCLVAGADHVRLFEITMVHNPTADDIEITSVELSDAQNLQMESFEVVLVEEHPYGTGYEVDDRPDLQSEGVTLPAGQYATVVAFTRLVNTNVEGTSSGITVHHHASGSSEDLKMDPPVTLKIVPNGTVCEEL